MTSSDLKRERSHDMRLANRQLRKGKAQNNKTEPVSPRGRSLTADEDNKPNSIFLSKTKRANLANEYSLGPGLYNPHENDGLGTQRESAFRKKIDFGNQEGRKFSMHRNLLSPFIDSTYLVNPDSYKYQYPDKDSIFY